jgi:hypothetical protein
MFVAVALMCMSPNVQTCTMMSWKEAFVTLEACQKHSDGFLGVPGPQGIIVYTACFKMPGEEA